MAHVDIFYLCSNSLVFFGIVLTLAMDWYVYGKIIGIDGNLQSSDNATVPAEELRNSWLGISVAGSILGVGLIIAQVISIVFHYIYELSDNKKHAITYVVIFLAGLKDLPLQILSLITLSIINTHSEPCVLASDFLVALSVTGGVTIVVSIVRLVQKLWISLTCDDDYKPCKFLFAFYHVLHFVLGCAVFFFLWCLPAINNKNYSCQEMVTACMKPAWRSVYNNKIMFQEKIHNYKPALHGVGPPKHPSSTPMITLASA